MKSKNALLLIVISSMMGAFGPNVVPVCIAAPARVGYSAAQPGQASSPSAVVKRIGVIKAINGSVITLTADSAGPEISVNVQPNAHMLRMVPGDKDLKNAAPIQVQDLQAGDTVRVRGYGAADAKSIDALEIIVITSSALQAVAEQVRQDWQKRGVAGLVDSVDPAGGTVTLSIPGLTTKRTIIVHTSKSTLVHRYSSDSAKPEDAKSITLQEIQPGDQLRARGTRNADGSEFAAEEIYTGVFPQFVGTIKSVDAGAGTLSIEDLTNKKTVQLKINSDSQLHKIPTEMAQKYAAILRMAKSGAAGRSSGGAAASGYGNNPAAAATAPAPGMASSGTPSGATPGMGRRAGGGMAGEFQRSLDQTPPVALADLHKGDAIAVLATQGRPSGASTVIKLFSGVEPILQAAPNGSQAMMLAPWSLGGAPGGDAGSQ